jgi:hypothetical protein
MLNRAAVELPMTPEARPTPRWSALAAPPRAHNVLQDFTIVLSSFFNKRTPNPCQAAAGIIVRRGPGASREPPD